MSIPILVLDHEGGADIAYRPGGASRLTREYGSFPQLVYLADLAKAYQLWVHPRWSARHPVATEAAWSLVPTDDERQRVAIVFPERDRRLAAFAGARDGQELLGSLLGLERALGTWFVRSPGGTAEAMIRADLRRRGLHETVELPDVALGRPVEGPLAWIRPLTPGEAAQPWLVAVDKHAAYLTAMGHLELGLGSPERRAAPAFDRRLPGYWLARLGPPLRSLPDPTCARTPRHEQEWRWLTTPSMRAADEQGRVFEIREAWVWPRHSRVLAPFADRLRRARTRLQQQRGTEVALAVLKRLYASQVGRLRMRRESGPDPLYRPDWHDHLVAEARVNLWFNALEVVRESGLGPVGAAIDCWYFPAPVREGPPGLRYGDGAGEYGVKAAVPMAAVRDIFRTRHVRVLADHVAQLGREAAR